MGFGDIGLLFTLLLCSVDAFRIRALWKLNYCSSFHIESTQIHSQMDKKPIFSNERGRLSELVKVLLIGSCLLSTPLVSIAIANEVISMNTNENIQNPSISSETTSSSESTPTTQLYSDELLVTFDTQELGIALTEQSYKGFPVVSISRITDTNLATSQPDLRIGAVITQVGTQKVDGLPLREIGALVKSANRPLVVKFRDPSR